MALRRTTMTQDLYEYAVRMSVRESETLRRLRERTVTMPDAAMIIPQEEGQFLYTLVSLIGARKTLELGVFTGYSGLWTALALPDDGQLIACDVSEEWAEIAQKYWRDAGVAHKCQLRVGPAGDTLAALVREGHSESFDFAFIDADKGSYLRYYEEVLRLIRPGGVIALDNTLWGGAVCDGQIREIETDTIRRLNELVSTDMRVVSCLIPFADGLTLAVKRPIAAGAAA